MNEPRELPPCGACRHFNREEERCDAPFPAWVYRHELIRDVSEVSVYDCATFTPSAAIMHSRAIGRAFGIPYLNERGELAER